MHPPPGMLSDGPLQGTVHPSGRILQRRRQGELANKRKTAELKESQVKKRKKKLDGRRKILTWKKGRLERGGRGMDRHDYHAGISKNRYLGSRYPSQEPPIAMDREDANRLPEWLVPVSWNGLNVNQRLMNGRFNLPSAPAKNFCFKASAMACTLQAHG